MENKRICKYGDTYTVRRMRLLSFLTKEKKMYPYATIPDKNNPRYCVWKYENSPELEDALEEYFSRFSNK